MTKDYYKILDIPEFSTTEDIKNAYRRLARKWHPDIAGNAPDVIAKFKEINEAYEILSDKNRKVDYDTARRFYSYAKSCGSNGVNSGVNNGAKERGYSEDSAYFREEKGYKTYSRMNREEKAKKYFNWEDLFGKKTKKTEAPKKGEDIYSDVEISVFEAINGCTKVINMLQTNICPSCKGRKFINGTKCHFCHGKGESSVYKKFNVKIPAGIKDKSKIRLAGEGEKGLNGGNNGDLYLTIHIKEPKTYKTEGLNILKTIPVAPHEAALGGDITIATLKGNVSLKLSPNTRNGQKIRLAGCGIEQNNKVGDMIVTVEIQIPKQMSDEEISLYKRLRELAGENIRERVE